MDVNNFIKLCRCPICKKDFHVCEDISVVECENKHQFALVDNRIPLLLPDQELSKQKSDFKSNIKTSESFSNQWQMCKDEDTIWGWDRQKMTDIFLTNSGTKAEQVPGKRILDLGCGHGRFSYLLSQLGAEVIGCDISKGFFAMESTLKPEEKEKINFLQGDVFNFPLKENIVDLVWCSGVLHHTPDTKRSFMNVHKVVKKGGRFYMWLYKNVYYTPTLVAIRKITTKLPESILVPFCYLLAPIFSLTKAFLTLTKKNYRVFEKKSLRENALSIHDTLAPPYRWHHHKEEAIRWFEEANFKNIIVSEDSALGFGIYGEKA